MVIARRQATAGQVIRVEVMEGEGATDPDSQSCNICRSTEVLLLSFRDSFSSTTWAGSRLPDLFEFGRY